MTAAECEYWWQKDGHFNMELFNNYLRAKKYAEFQSNIQSKGWQVDDTNKNNQGKQSRRCHQKNGPVATTNKKN